MPIQNHLKFTNQIAAEYLREIICKDLDSKGRNIEMGSMGSGEDLVRMDVEIDMSVEINMDINMG